MLHAGKALDTYFILDGEGGALMEVDELAYKSAKLMEEGEQSYEKIVSSLSRSFSESDIREVLSELDELRRQGVLNVPCLQDKVKFPKPAIKSMCLHIAHDCNLRCSYCFAKEGSYMGNRELMSEEVAKAALDFLVERSENRIQLEVDFFGGEPLINFGVVKAAVAYGRELEKKHGKIIRFTLTTNAYAVTDEISDFINSEMKNLVISIDGRKEIHDRERKNAAGAGSYDRVAKNAQKLIAGRGDQEYYIRGTYTSRNLDFANDVLSIADLGFDQISVEPVVTDGELALTLDHIPQIRAEYEKLGRIIEARREDGRPFNFFHFMIAFDGGPCLSKRLRGCGAGTEYVAVTPGGDIYPCHQFAGKRDFLMGNVLKSTETNQDIAAKFAGCHVYAKEKCQSCFAKYHCSGGCAANAYNVNGDIMKPHDVSCEIQKARMDVATALYIRKNKQQ